MSSDATDGDAKPADAAREELLAELRRHARSTYGPEVLETDGGSAGLYALPGQVGLFARRCRNPVLVARVSGLGAKLRIARRLGRCGAVGVDLVAQCVNGVLVQGALPLLFLAQATGGPVDPREHLEIVQGMAEGCREADCALLGEPAAEPADPIGAGEGDLAGFAIGVVERARLIDGRRRVRPGDLVLGLGSAGLHASGLALASRVLLDEQRMAPDQAVAELGGSVGDELLRPASIYVRPLRAVLDHYRVKGVIHALAHIAEGGLVSGLARAAGRRCVVRLSKASWPRPPIFDLVARLGALAEAEMFRVFNMGIGMAAIVAPFYADAILRLLRRQRQPTSIIGEVARGEGPAVELD